MNRKNEIIRRQKEILAWKRKLYQMELGIGPYRLPPVTFKGLIRSLFLGNSHHVKNAKDEKNL
jgi:hypothetical protein